MHEISSYMQSLGILSDKVKKRMATNNLPSFSVHSVMNTLSSCVLYAYLDVLSFKIENLLF